MRNDELDTIWRDVELQNNSRDKFYQRMIYVDLLYRAYIGSTGIPAKRCLSIEIPKSDKEQFDTFIVPQGFTLKVEDPSVKHDGYVACVLQAASSDQNDVFTVVAKDILDDLRKQKRSDEYLGALKHRIEKWREFFKNPVRKKLSEGMVIGLIGELSFIKNLMENGITCGSDLWNGPIKASQDFQGNQIAMEVKTASSNSLEYVHISSEIQLDDNDRDALFLFVYRVERNDAYGKKLPDVINDVVTGLTDQQKGRFYAKLLCLGYSDEDAGLYTKGYAVKEHRIYQVKEGFPRLLRHDLPQGVMETQYKLYLYSCEKFASDMDKVVKALKEYEYGQS